MARTPSAKGRHLHEGKAGRGQNRHLRVPCGCEPDGIQDGDAVIGEWMVIFSELDCA